MSSRVSHSSDDVLRSVRPRPGHGRRGTALLLVACLALATGVALFGVGATLTDAQLAPPSAGASVANAELVGAFYDAVNEAIRSGKTDRIDAVVAPDVAWCQGCPDQVQ